MASRKAANFTISPASGSVLVLVVVVVDCDFFLIESNRFEHFLLDSSGFVGKELSVDFRRR